MRDRMIAGAVRLLAQQGLQATSFAAAVDVAGDHALRVLDGLAGQSPERVTETFLGLWRLLLERSGNSAGCAVLAVTRLMIR